MSYAKVLCVGLVGVTGHLVEVEADVAAGLPAVIISGLPDTTLHEARDRVRAAIVNSGQQWPSRRITVNLLPATLPKIGSGFDLAVATALLGGAGELPLAPVDGVALLGELGLDGTVRPVRGVLPMVAAAARAGATRVVVPVANAAEAAAVPGVRVKAVDTLHRLVSFIHGEGALLDAPIPAPAAAQPGPDLADVAGQGLGKRALEIAAAGGHHLALLGPPGAGKTMLAERLPGLLPELDDEAALEVSALHSIAGVLPPGSPLLRRPPFQAPHHSATVASLVGGGTGLARPGAVSLAHQGVLFLDEAAEFNTRALESLRQPLEKGRVLITRALGVTEYPARCQLVLAANPCPCAKPAGDQYCECPPTVRRRYRARLSGPLMDRIDLQINIPAIRAAELLATSSPTEPSAVVADRVAAARTAAVDRWSGSGWRSNATVPGPALRQPPWRLPPADTAALRHRLDTGAISARGFDRVLRLAWSIADLDARTRPDSGDVDEAIQLRTGEM
ncbi:YifB family Mg chelatase-like AAA ATPase [Solwaraspora sp. WMMB335]|uniref:YifB family Mg chelatase-like AAA ATPase n=1 Tax=Solwaraspora sp. WMMB335 TaxID=3404118 RepID=UPI003B938F6A